MTELNALDGLERRCSLTIPLTCDDEVLPASICMSAVATSSPAVTFFCDGQICHWIGGTTTTPRNVMLSWKGSCAKVPSHEGKLDGWELEGRLVERPLLVYVV